MSALNCWRCISDRPIRRSLADVQCTDPLGPMPVTSASHLSHAKSMNHHSSDVSACMSLPQGQVTLSLMITFPLNLFQVIPEPTKVHSFAGANNLLPCSRFVVSQVPENLKHFACEIFGVVFHDYFPFQVLTRSENLSCVTDGVSPSGCTTQRLP